MTVKTETATVALTVKVGGGRVERVGRGGVVKEVAGAAAANSNMRISPIRRRYVYHIKSRLSIVSYMRYTCDTLASSIDAIHLFLSTCYTSVYVSGALGNVSSSSKLKCVCVC